jgi:TIR domain-containing protein
MKPLIFISHSAKDREVAIVDANDADAVQRRRRLEYARLVRGKIVDKLRAMTDAQGEGRFNVWLDQEILAGGDVWPARLHGALGECDAAVILLDAVSAASDWVRKEATIVTFRASTGAPVLVVPVFLGDVSRSVLDTGSWRSIDLQRHQALWIDDDPMTKASAEQLATLVAERFVALTRVDDDTPMGRWVADVGALIARARGPNRRAAAQMLGIDDAEWGGLSDPCATLAHHLLYLTLAQAYEPTRQLVEGLDADAGRRLVARVVPIWVTAQAGGHLHATVERGGQRLILLNLQFQASAHDYLQRAWHGQLDFANVVSLPGVTGESADEVLADVERGLREDIGLADDEAPLLDRYLQDGRVFVLIGPNGVRRDVVRALRERYPSVCLVAFPGNDWAAPLATLPEAVLIEPPVSIEEEHDARVRCRKLTRQFD